MSSRMKYGSLSRSLGEKLSKLSSPRKTESPLFKSKQGSKKVLSDELTNGLRKLSGHRNISPDLLEWINNIELSEKEKSMEKRFEAQVKDVENTPPASPLKSRRGSATPALLKVRKMENDGPKSGKLYIRVAELRNKLKHSKEEKVLYCMVTVLKCSLATTPVDFKNVTSFEEGFVFDVVGDFDVCLEVFVQPKQRGENEKYEMPESLGVLKFTSLSVLPVEMLTGVYYLNKDGEDTENCIKIQFAIKPHEQEELSRDQLPEPDFSGLLSRQVPNINNYNWVMDECELRGRTLRFYNDNKKVKTLRVDPGTVAVKAGRAGSDDEEEQILPYNCFQIKVEGKPVYLMAQSKEDMALWISKINHPTSSTFIPDF